MLVTFKTDTYPNIIMFGNDALAMLKMMGHSATVPGSIRAEDVAHALDQLKGGIDKQESPPPVVAEGEKELIVSTAHRGMPLIDLLTAAVKANDYVMWDTSTIID
jgi:hypothetical protein